jgi:hypothetical protein
MSKNQHLAHHFNIFMQPSETEMWEGTAVSDCLLFTTKNAKLWNLQKCP